MTKVQEREEEKSQVREVGRTNFLKQMKEQMDSITPLPVKILNKNLENILVGEIECASFLEFLFTQISNDTCKRHKHTNASRKSRLSRNSTNVVVEVCSSFGSMT